MIGEDKTSPYGASECLQPYISCLSQWLGIHVNAVSFTSVSDALPSVLKGI